MIHSERVAVEPAPLPADGNVRKQYPIQDARWVRHPDQAVDEASFCRYTLAFELAEAATITLHVTADQRFELSCDDQHLGMGPDRSDVEHWSFHSYRVQLDAGEHELSAEVHYLGAYSPNKPCAQTSVAPGFLLCAEGSPVDLNTGSAAWRVTKLTGIETERVNLRAYFVVGPNYYIDAADYFNPPAAVDAIEGPIASSDSESGLMQPFWKLYPTRLPEQTRDPVGGGRIRCVADIDADAPLPDRDWADAPVPASAWQALVDGRAPVTVPANTRMTVLWDLDEYRTAYPELTATGGAGARVQLDWAESCYLHRLGEGGEGKSAHDKGNRDEVAGKFFRGNGDAMIFDGPQRTLRPLWWRAGRYVRIRVTTGDEALTLEKLRLLETRMPLANDGVFASDDAALGAVIDVAVRGIQMCAHETYMDCPYYEQMMYTGDTRLQVLTSFVMSGEDRLNQRTLELFDWSRRETGFVLERYPSQPKQLSCTFAMIWVMMLRDYAWWRDDAAFVGQRLKGMRCLLEEFKALPDTHAPLLPALPGWSFMDWVKGMSFVNHPGPDASVSSVTNLLFVNALNSAAELEAAFGEPHLAEYNRAWAKRIAGAIDERFWDERRGLFANDVDHAVYSEHAQCLALLSGHFPQRDERCFESLITADDLLRTTVYFSFYLLEAMAKFGRGDLICRKLDFWKRLVDQGMKTPVEMPEPSRSDCHAWGSHPLFHLHASLAGIRPDAPGFGRVRITPRPGALTELSSTIPHPAGTVSLSMKRRHGQWRARVELPDGVEGTLVWDGASHPLGGSAELVLPIDD